MTFFEAVKETVWALSAVVGVISAVGFLIFAVLWPFIFIPTGWAVAVFVPNAILVLSTAVWAVVNS